VLPLAADASHLLGVFLLAVFPVAVAFWILLSLVAAGAFVDLEAGKLSGEDSEVLTEEVLDMSRRIGETLQLLGAGLPSLSDV
jgi:hypothetical protein